MATRSRIEGWQSRPRVGFRAWAASATFALGLLASTAAAPAREPAPLDLTLSGFGQSDVRLSSYAGDVVVLHFWASWCQPCRREIPSLSDFYKGPYQLLKPEGLVVLTVSNDVRDKDLQQFLDHYHPPFPVFYDSLGRVNERVRMQAIPGTVIIGRDGQVVARWIGEQDWGSQELMDRLEAYVRKEPDPTR